MTRKVVNLKILLAGLSLLIFFGLPVACIDDSMSERSAVVNYLKAYNRIDNELTDTYDDVMESIASWASCDVPPGGGIAQIAGVFEDGLKKLLALKVPDIPEVKTLYESSKRILTLEVASLRDMKAGLDADNPGGYSQGYSGFSEAMKQTGEVHRAIEAQIAKYKITDAEVVYRFRSR